MGSLQTQSQYSGESVCLARREKKKERAEREREREREIAEADG